MSSSKNCALCLPGILDLLTDPNTLVKFHALRVEFGEEKELDLHCHKNTMNEALEGPCFSFWAFMTPEYSSRLFTPAQKTIEEAAVYLRLSIELENERRLLHASKAVR